MKNPNALTVHRFLEVTCKRDEYRPPTQSQRLRATLYRLWERSGSGETFEDWYQDRMDRIIARLQRLLD
jgi:hypothetical protein